MTKQAFTRLPMLTLFLVFAALMLATSANGLLPHALRFRSASAFDCIPSVSPQLLVVNIWTIHGPRAPIRSLAIDPRNPNIIYAGSEAGTVFHSTNGGVSWRVIEISLTESPVTALAIDPFNAATIYAETGSADMFSNDGVGVFKSTDGGTMWNAADTGLPEGVLSAPMIDPKDSNTIYLGVAYSRNGGVYKSTDGGARWGKVSNLDNASLVAVDPINSNTVYVLSAVGYFEDEQLVLFKSNDSGASYSDLGLTNPDALAISPSSPNVLYASAYGYVNKSTDGGATWKTSNNGLPGVFIGVLVIDPVDPDKVYAGTPKGVVFKSEDGGVSWGAMNNGLPDLSVNSLLIDPSGAYLLAGTAAGVFDYQNSKSCTYSISAITQSFEAGGGTSTVDVVAEGDCGWTAINYQDWISFDSGSSSGSGNRTISYSAPANTSTLPRTDTLIIAAHSLVVNQAGLPVRIINASVAGKKLFVMGENFDFGAVILVNGEEQITRSDDANPKTTLIGKKAGKKVKPGDKLQVRNPNGTLSQEFIFALP